MVLTNGGATKYANRGKFGPLENVWYHEAGLENIVSLALLKQVANVSFDSSRDSAFVATFSNGQVWRFEQTVNGLFIYEHVHTTKVTNENVFDYCLISTVEVNEKQFHRREVEGAVKAGDFYRRIGRPSRRTFENAIKSNLFQNCPITIDDVQRFFEIYGPDVATLQGKTKKRISGRSVASLPCPLPSYVLRNHRHITLCIDIFYVQGIPFFHSISTKINFRTATQLSNRSKQSLNEQYQQIKR